mmetsp:Transcript_17446/g.16655  ORF Transcript_17446/g.16655 Transcript_17446/m.16655 type:complete len:109 (-) Transcript_17446:67-393(-)
MSSSAIACGYAALLLQDDDVPVTADKLKSILDASKIEYESYWPDIFAKNVADLDLKDLITSISSGGAAPVAVAVAAPAAGGAAPAAAEKKKEESDDESDDDMGLGLFD